MISPKEQIQDVEPGTTWVSRAAFPIVSAGFYGAQALLVWVVWKQWWWAAVPLSLVVSHFMHAFLIAFHEASHGLLRKNRLLNEIDGVIMGITSLTSFTLYRALHQKHHANLATEKDVELWPFVNPRAPLWGRRLAAFLELNFGMFYTPFLFWRVFFARPSPVSSKRVRRRIRAELALTAGFWSLAMWAVVHFSLWPWFWFNYFVPAFIAGNLQSWRKYIEHVGLSGHTARSATRSIVADTAAGRLVSLTLLHEPLHGIHHIKSNIPHSGLPARTAWLEPAEAGDTAPYPNYRAAFADLLRQLPDPRVGKQWGAAR